MAGRDNSATNVCFTPDVSMGPATSSGSATARGTGVDCCVIKVWKSFSFVSSPPTQDAGRVPALILHVPSSYSHLVLMSNK